jgi:hypothetical protein
MNLTERLRALVGHIAPTTRRFVALEEATGIKAETWRTWWNRGGKASADMIQGIGEAWPEYAFWLVTGVDDSSHGHKDPTAEKKLMERDAARNLFLHKMYVRKWCEENSWDINEDLALHYDPETLMLNGKANEIDQHLAQTGILEYIRDRQETTFKEMEAKAENDRQQAKLKKN